MAARDRHELLAELARRAQGRERVVVRAGVVEGVLYVDDHVGSDPRDGVVVDRAGCAGVHFRCI